MCIKYIIFNINTQHIPRYFIIADVTSAAQILNLFMCVYYISNFKFTDKFMGNAWAIYYNDM